MFGYVIVNKGELKVKEYTYYKSCYCGLCRTLRKKYGTVAGFMVNYDMVFLSMLLTSLYEKPYHGSYHKCMVHPVKKQVFRENEFTDYAADMTMLLTYYNLMDNWKDEKNIGSLAVAEAFKREYRQTAKKYKRQARAVLDYMKKIEQIEQEDDGNPDAAANATGEMMSEIFLYQEDAWQEQLRKIGYYMGKFVYFLDAYDDLEKDLKNHGYNPFKSLSEQDDFEEIVEEILKMTAVEAAREFEMLPVIVNASILRNILYSGIWQRYSKKRQEKEKRKEEQRN